MRTLILLALLVLFTACRNTYGQAPIRAVEIQPGHIEALANLSKNMKETPACLLGHQRDTIAVVDAILIPTIIESTDTTVTYSLCPRKSTVAMWHNHPPYKNLSARERCYISMTDMFSALSRRAIFTIVQPDSTTLCYWRLDQVYAALDHLVERGDHVLMYAWPGQLLHVKEGESYVLRAYP